MGPCATCPAGLVAEEVAAALDAFQCRMNVDFAALAERIDAIRAERAVAAADRIIDNELWRFARRGATP